MGTLTSLAKGEPCAYHNDGYVCARTPGHLGTHFDKLARVWFGLGSYKSFLFGLDPGKLRVYSEGAQK